MSTLPPITQVRFVYPRLAADLIFNAQSLLPLSIFLSPPQLAGNYGSLFEGYFQQLDVTRNGRIDASSAAAFLKKSQLGDPVLHKVSVPYRPTVHTSCIDIVNYNMHWLKREQV